MKRLCQRCGKLFKRLDTHLRVSVACKELEVSPEKDQFPLLLLPNEHEPVESCAECSDAAPVMQGARGGA